MDIKINDYYEPEHFKALNEADYDVSHSCDYEKNAMHHIHESTEILIVESGSADYYIDGRKYYVEAGDILIIGSRKSHMRRMDRLPFARYGLAVNPSYYRRLNLGEDMLKVWQGPSPEEFVQHFKDVPTDVFSRMIELLKCLYEEQRYIGDGGKIHVYSWDGRQETTLVGPYSVRELYLEHFGE